MRVLVVTSLFPNDAQPHKAPFNRQQIEALAGISDVRVIAPVPFTKMLRRGVQSVTANDASGRENRNGLLVSHPTYYFTPKVMRGVYGSFFVKSIAGEFERCVEQFRPDIVLGCWAYPDGWAAMHLARRHGLPVALKIQGSDVLQVGDRGVRARRVCEVLRGVDGVVAVSAHLAERAIGMGVSRDRVRTVYNGVDTTRFCPGDRTAAKRTLGNESDVPLITFVGNMVPVKGVDILIRALGVVQGRGLKFRCVFVGDGAERVAYARMAVREGIADHVRFVGSCPLERMPLWHRASDLLVLPSRSEGVPNVLREAQACGTPFIATRVGGVPEIALPSSLVPPNDPETLAQRIAEFLLAPRRSEDVHPIAEGISPATWQDSAAELLRVLEDVAGVTRSRGRLAA